MRLSISAMMAAVVLGLVVASCTSAAPAPTTAPIAPTKTAEPTKASAAPTAAAKAPEPTKPAAAPTAAPASKVTWPQAGRTITYIVPFAAGGGTDLSARTLAPFLEKELGGQVTITVVNKPGANTQVGMTELAAAKPDGYTMGAIDLPSTNVSYLLPERKATYTRKSFQPLLMLYALHGVWVVPINSPIKGVKDVVDAAKARPGEIKVGDTGFQGPYHFANLAFQQVTGTRLSLVHFDGGAPQIPAVLGGHIDVASTGITSALASVKAGQSRFIGTMGPKRDPLAPDVLTFPEQGYTVPGNGAALLAIGVPAGVPQEVADILTGALNRATANPEFRKKATAANVPLLDKHLGPAECEVAWTEFDNYSKEMLALAAKETK